MRQKSIFLILLILGSVRISLSQDTLTIVSFDPQHLLTLSSGISSHTMRDEMMSPLMYRGTEMPLAFTYRFRGVEHRHTVLFYYDNTELNSSITTFNNDAAATHYIDNLHLTFEYSFSTRVAEFENLRTTLFLGARLSSILNLRNHYFQSGNPLMSAEQMTGLGIHLLTETAIQKESSNYLRLEINIPCVSYVLLSEQYNARVGNSLDGIDVEKNIMWQLFKRGEVVSFNKLLEVQADVSYIFFVSDHFAVDLQYRLLYYSFAKYQDLLYARVLNTQFLLGMTVKL